MSTLNPKGNKKILFKLWLFPRLSETFILTQIITAINCGYNVRILVGELLEIDEVTHGKLIEKYKIRDKIIIEDYRIPENNFLRFSKAFILVIKNLLDLRILIRFLVAKRKFELKSIYIFNYFKRFRDYDIVHVQYGTNARPLDTLKKIGAFPPKLIVSFHGHDLFFPLNGRIENNGYYNDLFDSADKLVANTPYLKQLLEDLGAPIGKILTIPVSVDTDFFKPGNLHQRREVIGLITVGRLEKFKGQHLGIRCIFELVKKGYSVHYTIVGDGSQRDYLKDIISEKKLDNYITLTGRKSQEEIRNLLQVHDIFLMTSITDPEYGVETQGLVTAEAQACGMPVVAFDSGGVKYTLKEGLSGFVVHEADVEAMTNKIELLIKNSLLSKELGSNGRQFIEKEYSNVSVIGRWQSIYG